MSHDPRLIMIEHNRFTKVTLAWEEWPRDKDVLMEIQFKLGSNVLDRA